MNFSYAGYRTILHRLHSAGYKAVFFGDTPEKKRIFLRHDVDIDVGGVLPLHHVEREVGYASTWFFLPDSPLYNLLDENIVECIKQITLDGGKCALHIDAARYDCVDALQEDMDVLFAFFSSYLPLSRVVSFHRPSPFWKMDIELQNFENTYASRYFTDIAYVSDSNRRLFWEEAAYTGAFETGSPIQLLTHPVWWHPKEMGIQATLDDWLKRRAALGKYTAQQNVRVFNRLQAIETNE